MHFPCYCDIHNRMLPVCYQQSRVCHEISQLPLKNKQYNYCDNIPRELSPLQNHWSLLQLYECETKSLIYMTRAIAGDMKGQYDGICMMLYCEYWYINRIVCVHSSIAQRPNGSPVSRCGRRAKFHYSCPNGRLTNGMQVIVDRWAY